jgi:hypothetical protein
MFGGEHSLFECGSSVAGLYRDLRLAEDFAGVELFGHQMH